MRTAITILLTLIYLTSLSQNKIYWTDRVNFTINRSNLDGSEWEITHREGVIQVEDIAFDLTRNKMYWTEWTKIQCSDLNGDNIETLVTGLTRADGIALDTRNQKIYWTERGTGKIQRSNFDGSEIEDIVSSPVPESIALDVEKEKMYWTDWNGDNQKIYRANLNGSEKEVIVETINLGRPFGISLDLTERKMYWTDAKENSVSRANLNGSNIEKLISDLTDPSDIALDLEKKKMYITQHWNNTIRANIDGSNVEEITTFEVTTFNTGIAILKEDSSSTVEYDNEKLLVKPNPNEGDFSVVSGKIIKRVLVYSIDGRLILEENTNQRMVNIDMRNHAKGTYILKIEFDDKEKIAKKVIIQ